jgi:hypothetical protein
MMPGHVDPQGSLLELGLLFGDLVTRGSFHDKLAACGHELISDHDSWGSMPSTGAGRRPRRRS